MLGRATSHGEVADVKERVRDLASRGLVTAGFTRVGRRLRDQGGALILYGHRVSADDESFFQGLAPQWFREQLEYLARHYEIIPLSTLVACVEESRPFPPRSVVLTFDDGFRDFVEQAMPLLEASGAKATVFVVTQSLSEGHLPWSQRLGYAFQHSTVTELEHPSLGPRPVSLASTAERRGAYARVKLQLVSLAREPRDAIISEIADRLAVDPPRDRMMTWDHAREVLAAGHEVGAHTYSHPLLARIPPSEARSEMERSRVDLEEHLGLRSPTFCFPAGSTSATLQASVRDLGFRSCFLPNQTRRFNRLGEVDAFSLVRVGLPNAPATHLEAELDGPFHAIRRMGRYLQPLPR
jgi:peptidoglycan/xylan/chitin deacetylase (PgdA/CDA1 family)